MLERLTPDAERVGGNGPAASEAIRFLHDPSLGFQAGEVSRARAIETGGVFAFDPALGQYVAVNENDKGFSGRGFAPGDAEI